MFFSDRTDAGRRLAARLDRFKGHDVVVLGLPRGGVPVAAEVADALGAPLDICLVRKLGVPRQPELAMGALGEGGVRVLNERVLRDTGVDERELAAVEEREHRELEERGRRYRGSRPAVPLEGRTVLIVDDGLATGATALAACRVVRARGAARIVLAVPVAPHGWTARLGGEADETVSVRTPEPFYAIGQFYRDFSQTPDAEVVACLDRSRAAHDPVVQDTDVRVPLAGVTLPGRLAVPEGATGIVLFAHGSGSGRHSPRNRAVAAALNRAGLGTLLFDLLTETEAVDRAHVFDTPLLAGRLAGATEWLAGEPASEGLPLGYFGASTGAAAALWAAGDPASPVAAVVSRGGRPDLAAEHLGRVRAPTLLVVGGRDLPVLDLNRRARSLLRCESRLEVVEGATHLFEEPGALEEVAELATSWFTGHFRDQ
ncbi:MULTISPECIES: phosphoribosyltransferase family protein [unclassified Streptomyces]|uniref:phosphoribosyltransferase family protein n=1 Tax=unclassified Streptomyces TaxID=2593676 RepID=UPI0006F1CD3C|nr:MULTISPECIES: phosphoribosyltransferase family protein [unclassified Streptomyces]KQX46172.1 phosphoribosyl transferase [Streptomyces sp. Root1304]KRA80957.1 phosphoribosyl transferase [Streptomyces sp. Root66D1]